MVNKNKIKKQREHIMYKKGKKGKKRDIRERRKKGQRKKK